MRVVLNQPLAGPTIQVKDETGKEVPGVLMFGNIAEYGDKTGKYLIDSRQARLATDDDYKEIARAAVARKIPAPPIPKMPDCSDKDIEAFYNPPKPKTT